MVLAEAPAVSGDGGGVSAVSVGQGLVGARRALGAVVAPESPPPVSAAPRQGAVVLAEGVAVGVDPRVHLRAPVPRGIPPSLPPAVVLAAEEPFPVTEGPASTPRPPSIRRYPGKVGYVSFVSVRGKRIRTMFEGRRGVRKDGREKINSINLTFGFFTPSLSIARTIGP